MKQGLEDFLFGTAMLTCFVGAAIAFAYAANKDESFAKTYLPVDKEETLFPITNEASITTNVLATYVLTNDTVWGMGWETPITTNGWYYLNSKIILGLRSDGLVVWATNK